MTAVIVGHSASATTIEAYNHLSPGAAEAKGDLTSRAASIPLSPGG
jgi:hypothetical protein